MSEFDEADDETRKYNIRPGEMIAMAFVDIANSVESYQKANRKQPGNIVDDAIDELTEMLRGEDKSLDILMNILLPTYKKLRHSKNFVFDNEVSMDAKKEILQVNTLKAESIIKDIHAGSICRST
jgi:hypothetical protein